MFISQRGLHTINQNVFAYGKHFKNINITFNKRAFVSSTYSGSFDQMVPKTSEEAQELFNKAPQSHPDSKLLKVAVIGVPNSGKSTLINQLIGWKICSVSQKVHTTQCSARAVFSQGLTQLVFVDTPGIVTPEEIKKHDLKTSLIIDPEKSLEQSDLIVVMHDVSNSYAHKALHPRVLRILFLYPTIPSVLALNKVDTIKKKNVLLEITNNLTDGIVGDTKIKVTSEAEITDEELADTLIHSEISKNTSKSSINTNAPPESRNQDKDAKTSLIDFGEESSRELSLDDVMSGKIKPTEKEVQELIKGKERVA
ncbi:GTPase Era, mitochondrial [Armadillidium nasatum]|uniref:GTPase Era, mitochondrial n=1 Tax=Armadillidium nasatum TaxID=96803 RepID=A0A5N5TKT4_9CRUS|nr:GTPase Era, mitochondrial [Armadillidium nasatum]